MLESVSKMADGFDGRRILKFPADKSEVIEGISIGPVAELEDLFEALDGLLILG